ncbi:hypothetical protein J4Q44_G00367430 [Coregonus suidteri]|uniref:Uncharacterized protein n=1 Tax=Coregonus suidteri TaxID=861788 RepID=A0AAN8QKU7_9TELE
MDQRLSCTLSSLPSSRPDWEFESQRKAGLSLKFFSTVEKCQKGRRRSVMSERFVVVRVGQGDDGVSNDPVPDSGGAEGDSIDPQDSVPILEYSREPNRYGCGKSVGTQDVWSSSTQHNLG